jgi:hypothetical protein
MLKKTMMLVMAAAVVAAFAVPATASAGLWKHHATNIQQNQQITLTGNAKFDSGAIGNIECQTTSQLTATAGTTTGTVTQFTPDLDEANSTVTTKCKAGGFLAGCQVHSAVPSGLPWTVHNNTKTVAITNGDITVGFTGGFCPGDTATVTASTVTATPNQPKTVSSFTLSGQVQVHILKGGVTQATSTATVSGTQNILAPNAATYSLE